MIIESFNSNVKTFYDGRRESDAGDTFPDGVQTPASGGGGRGLGLPGDPLQPRHLHPELPPQGPHTRYKAFLTFQCTQLTGFLAKNQRDIPGFRFELELFLSLP